MRRVVKKIFFAFLLLTGASSYSAVEPTINSLPPNLPVIVETSFFLANLDRIDERVETFDANIYVDFKWHDSRLAFTPQPGESNTRMYVQDKAREKLKEIWWPQQDFLNDTYIQYNNLILAIQDDGTVQYSVAVTAIFRTYLDYRRFPFDKQTLTVKIDSFMWDDTEVVFLPVTASYEKQTIPDLRSLYINDVTAHVETYEAPMYEDREYSSYIASIHVERNPTFYIYQMLIPLFIVMGISFCAFLFPMTDLPNKIYLALTGILAFFWTKFTINQDLPKIGYMTILDKAFMVSYICGGLTVFISALEHPVLRDEAFLRRRLHQKIRWGLPLLYVLLIVLTFLFS